MDRLLSAMTVVSGVLFLLVLISVRRAHIRVEYSVSWLLAAAALRILSRSRGLLETAGIEAMTQNREAPQDILPGVGGVVVMVRPDQAEEALATIEAYRAQPATDEDEAVSEEPAQP